MIDRPMLETRRTTLQEQRDAQARHLLELQQALRVTERNVAQLDGALFELAELLTHTPEAPATNGTPPEKENA